LVIFGGKKVNFDESIVLNVVHCVVLSELDDDRVLDTVNSILGVVTSVDLAKGSL
jgi:hypothetical protein